MPLPCVSQNLLLGNYRDISHSEQRVSGKAPGILYSQHPSCGPWFYRLRWGQWRGGLRKDTWKAFWIQTLAFTAYTDCVTFGQVIKFLSESDFFPIFNLRIVIAHNCEARATPATEPLSTVLAHMVKVLVTCYSAIHTNKVDLF